MPGVFSYLRSIRHLARADENDGTLLERFRTQRDEQAFATLVQRHGPLILGIIRRLVGPGDQADDVFQATFLVLARKGQSMERWPSIAGWLVQVARRTALQAQAKSARRLRHEQQAASMNSHITTTDPARTMEQQDLAHALDAELDKLPGKYRTPIILCQLQGQTREETARQLGWPLGSVAGRLARGKKLLQERLIKRGIIPTLVTGALKAPTTQAQVPVLLVHATTLLACHVVHNTSQVPASTAITLAQGVMTSMLMTKVKYAAAALLLVCMCVGTGVWAWPGKGEPKVAQAQSPKIEAKTSRATDYDRLEGIWRKEERNPVTNELESAEELIFRKNMYLRRYIHKGSHHDGPPSVFALNETTTPKQIDLDIVSVADANDKLQEFFSRTDMFNRGLYIRDTINKNLLRERLLGIYELKDNEFTYQISGAVPFILKGDKLVPDPQSPLNRRPTAFEPGNNATEAFKSLSVTFKRVEKSLKDSLNLRDAPHQEVPSGATQPNPSPDVSPQILELKQQRLKVAEERMEHWQKTREELIKSISNMAERSNKQIDAQALGDFEGAATISQQLLEARLDIAKDNEARIKAYEEHIRILQLAEKAGEVRYERRLKSTTSESPSSGMISTTAKVKDNLLENRYRRIEAMIKLEELKAKK